jgi:hypothetical protein
MYMPQRNNNEMDVDEPERKAAAMWGTYALYQ